MYSAMTGSARTPDFLVPPNERRTSEPSMIRYMRERKPAPPPAKGQ
jgi:hypothetical protein